ncbi:hypothetical protein OAV27_01780 [Euryarchaeota archaeon]|nr:hypothetical protein [Euryarchaeota archaeon]
MTEQPIIVLDAANVGWSSGNNKFCSGKGLIEAIGYCRNHGFKPVAFLPNNYLYNPRQPKRLITDMDDIQEEVRKGSVIAVPPKDDDDLYMITYAQKKGVKLVSNDLFRDYIKNSEDSAAESWVKNNVISYSFVLDEFFPNPKFTKFFGKSVSHIMQTDMPKEPVKKSATLRESAKPTTIPEPVASTDTPPIPAEGLPPEWTIEQWNYYGAQWLAQQAPVEPTTTPKPVASTDTPPIPAEGLPPEWTIEQWNYYGAQWLAQQTPAESIDTLTNSADHVIETSAKILEEILSIDESKDVEKALGFRYYCHICGDGFKKWGLANTHKKESGHGAYICGECNEILPSPKSAKEHQEITSHTTLTGSWVGQHDMRVKSIPDLTIELINSKQNPPDEILREIVLNRGVKDKEYQIWRFNTSGGITGRPRWPPNPKIVARQIHEFESFRGQDITWKELSKELAKKMDVPISRTTGIISVFKYLFHTNIQSIKPETPTGWNGNVIWSSVNIDGAIFERILRFFYNVTWKDDKTKPDGWIEEINDYLEDVKIYYARLG